MMRARLKTAEGGEILLLGLSFANIDRLRAQALDGYIHVKDEQLRIPFDVIIVAAETEADMLRAFAHGIGPDTEVHISNELKS